MTKHTELPWDVNTLAGKPYREVFSGRVLICDTGMGHAEMTECEANAHFIVRAVNNHDLLVEAILANQGVLLILRDASTHEPTRKLLADMMDCNTTILAKAKS